MAQSERESIRELVLTTQKYERESRFSLETLELLDSRIDSLSDVLR